MMRDVSLACHTLPPFEEGSSCHTTENAMLSLTMGETALFTVNQIKVFTLPTRLADLVSKKVEPTSGRGLV